MQPPPPVNKRWRLTEADPDLVRAVASRSGVSAVVARILVARGVVEPDEVRRFLAPDLARDWRDPECIPGMTDAADAVAAAVRARRRILVFGDFDVDGLTASAVATRGLRALGAEVSAMVPHRVNDGYGLTPSSVARALSTSPDLVVTVDCGISSRPEVAMLLDAGVQVVVTDHHEPGDDVPVGVPVADPKLAPSGEGFAGLAGAGVALKLVAAVGVRLGRPDAWLDLVDLAALGTIADIVPLLDENRGLVAHGLARIASDPRPCMAALAQVAGIAQGEVTADRVAFGISPRINAAGRMADPAEALDLLLTDDPAQAASLARALDDHNRARQSVEAELFEIASARAAARFRPGSRALILSGEGWHEGVKGIVASRLVAVFGVPVIMFSIVDGVAHGSGRSVGDVDLHAAVTSVADMLTRFGGHAAAVGVTLPAADLPRFEERLAAALASEPAESFVPEVCLDGEVALAAVGVEMVSELAALEPFGAANPRPLLAARRVFMKGRQIVGRDGNHLRFVAYDGIASVPAIAFRAPDIDAMSEHDAAVDLAFQIEADEWRGQRRVQLLVRDFSVCEPDPAAPASALVEDLFADAERILARGEYEGIADAESFHTKLAGVTFEGRQAVVASLEAGALLRIERQAGNEHDPNAIALFDQVGDHVGYFNRRLAAALAPAIDKGADYEVTVTDVTGRDEAGGSLGVNVLVASRGPDAGDDEAQAAAGQARRAELAALSPVELDAALVAHLIGDRALHDAQRVSLEHLAAGRSCLTVMATGRGKSLIFHLHAAREALRGRASVFVYPLRALVADQSFHLSEAFARIGIKVCLVTGETAAGARDEAFDALAAGDLDVVLTTPEFLDRHVARFAAAGRIGFVVVDEAHHVGLSRANHRPAYSRLGEALEALGRPTVLAVTATASDEVASAVISTLGISEVVLDPTVRDNLRVTDQRGCTDKAKYLALLAARGEKLIVYVNSREQSVRVAQRIRASAPELRYRTAFYNGGMARAARHAVETALRGGELTVVVATSAFGEGVNIPDVRHIALFHMPFNDTEFNQMCGRAGRDGEEATVHVTFGPRDSRLNDMILQSVAPDADDLRHLYAVLRDLQADAGDDAFEVTNAELAERVRKRRARSGLTDKGVSAGLGVFRELGFVTGEGAGGYRRLRLLPAPAAKVDLGSSVRYAEGVEEAEEFAGFRQWVLSASVAKLLDRLNRPILPSPQDRDRS
jgi:single-stranded-DNA-specific exonuclease